MILFFFLFMKENSLLFFLILQFFILNLYFCFSWSTIILIDFKSMVFKSSWYISKDTPTDNALCWITAGLFKNVECWHLGIYSKYVMCPISSVTLCLDTGRGFKLFLCSLISPMRMRIPCVSFHKCIICRVKSNCDPLFLST